MYNFIVYIFTILFLIEHFTLAITSKWEEMLHPYKQIPSKLRQYAASENFTLSLAYY